MSWLKIDDKLTSHHKWRAIGLYARALWLQAMVDCSAHNTDGRIRPYELADMAALARIPIDEVDGCVRELVAAGWWDRVRKGDGGGWQVRNWSEYQPTRQQVERRAEVDAFHRWLHKSALGRRVKDIVVTRDAGRCRYCSVECTPPTDHRSPARRTFDVVDPATLPDYTAVTDVAGVVAAVVLACGYCNAVKGRRRPDEAGLELRPAPTRGEGPTQHPTHSRPGREVGTVWAGSDRVGEVSGSGSGGGLRVVPEWFPPSDADLDRWEATEVAG